MKIRSLSNAVKTAIKVYKSDRPGEKPSLAPLGIRPLDDFVGGLEFGMGGVLGACTGVGKSSIMLHSALNSPIRVGLLSLEDPESVIGLRCIAEYANVSSTSVRLNKLSQAERARVLGLAKSIEAVDHVRLVEAVAPTVEEVEDGINALADDGCKMIWVDYLQKIRGASADRRNEVAAVFTRLQRAAYNRGVAIMQISQAKRIDGHRPTLHDLKESGDIENEARLVVLAYRMPDSRHVLRCHVAKSNHGGEDLKWAYRRNSNGALELIKSVGEIDVDDF